MLSFLCLFTRVFLIQVNTHDQGLMIWATNMEAAHHSVGTKNGDNEHIFRIRVLYSLPNTFIKKPICSNPVKTTETKLRFHKPKD